MYLPFILLYKPEPVYNIHVNWIFTPAEDGVCRGIAFITFFCLCVLESAGGQAYLP